MNTGQMMLSIGAMLLLSTLMLRVNSNNMLNETLRDEAQFGVLATSLATSVIEEAISKSFDEHSDSNSVSSLAELTLASKLGPEAGETYQYFNDFDDFNGFAKVDSSMPSASFEIKCSVSYVASSNILVKSTNTTWHKKIDVTVTSPFIRDTIVASSIFSYWSFR